MSSVTVFRVDGFRVTCNVSAPTDGALRLLNLALLLMREWRGPWSMEVR